MSECFHPVQVRTENGLIYVRCGRCLPCLKHRQGEWITRFREQNKIAKSVYFVTLTYREEERPQLKDDLSGEYYPSVSREHIKKLHADMRKRFQQGFFYDSILKDCGFSSKKSKIELEDCSFKYYVTSEYGSRGINPHYHGIYWDLPTDINIVLCLFQSLWPYGFVTVYPGTDEATAAYTAKYLINNSLVESHGLRPFAIMSKGLGASYLDNPKILDWHRQLPEKRCYVPIENRKAIMPRYYRDRIFDDEMKFVIAEGVQKRSDMRDKAISNMSTAEILADNERIAHQEREAYAQALWRFQKKNKIK